jgi:hypothetical protein
MGLVTAPVGALQRGHTMVMITTFIAPPRLALLARRQANKPVADHEPGHVFCMY